MAAEKQVVMILKHLQAGRKIQPLQALNLYGSQRLAARINDIEELGYNIHRKLIRVRKANGDYTRVMQYWL